MEFCGSCRYRLLHLPNGVVGSTGQTEGPLPHRLEGRHMFVVLHQKDTRRVLEACPNLEWRLIVALTLIAQKHYLQVTDEDFRRGAKFRCSGGAEFGAATGRTVSRRLARLAGTGWRCGSLRNRAG
jgi:hypothetical protein